MKQTYEEYLKMADFGLVSENDDPGLVKRDDWIQLVSPEAPTHWRNGVYHSQIEGDADERVKRVIDEYTQKNLPFRWMVGPYSSPSNLEDTLKKNGFEHFENTFGLILDMNKYQTKEHPIVKVRLINEEELETWCNVNCRGWEIPEQDRQHFLRTLKKDFQEKPVRKFYYIASINGEDVGASALKEMDGFINFLDAVVDKEHRGKGVYRAMIDQRVNDSKKKGFEFITNFCVETTSAPICMKLGFEKVYEYATYIYEKSHCPPSG